MSTFSEILGGLKAAITLTDDVKKSAETLKKQADVILDLSNRIIRLETQIDTMLRMGQFPPPSSAYTAPKSWGSKILIHELPQDALPDDSDNPR